MLLIHHNLWNDMRQIFPITFHQVLRRQNYIVAVFLDFFRQFFPKTSLQTI